MVAAPAVVGARSRCRFRAASFAPTAPARRPICRPIVGSGSLPAATKPSTEDAHVTKRSYRWPKWCASGSASTTSGAPEIRRASGASVSRLADERRSGCGSTRSKRPAREDQRLAADDRAVALVDRRRDDQVHLAELVLEQHEDDAVRGRRPLAGDGHPGDGHLSPVRMSGTARGSRGRRGQVRAQELHRMDADREARRAVVGEHPLPVGLLAAARASRPSARAAARAGAPRRPSRARSASAGRGRAPRAASRRGAEASRTRPEATRPRARRARAARAARDRRRRGTAASARSAPAPSPPPRRPIATYPRPTRTAPSSTAHLAALRFTCGGRTSTPRRCASRTRLAGG